MGDISPDHFDSTKGDAKRRLRNKSLTVAGVVKAFKVPRMIAKEWLAEVEAEDYEKKLRTTNPDEAHYVRGFQLPQFIIAKIDEYKDDSVSCRTREEAIIKIIFEYFHPNDYDLKNEAEFSI